MPNRENIMFHGGNSIEDVKGCVIVASKQNGEKVSGDLSQKFFDIVDAAGRSGDAVGLIVKNNNKKLFLILGVLGAIGVYFLTQKR